MTNKTTTQDMINCRWDPDNPESCFDEDACGCYIDPCDFFEVGAGDCMPFDEEEWCCTVVGTCCELER